MQCKILIHTMWVNTILLSTCGYQNYEALKEGKWCLVYTKISLINLCHSIDRSIYRPGSTIGRTKMGEGFRYDLTFFFLFLIKLPFCFVVVVFSPFLCSIAFSMHIIFSSLLLFNWIMITEKYFLSAVRDKEIFVLNRSCENSFA